MNIAGHQLGERSYLRVLQAALAWQERRLRVHLVEIFDDGERLGDELAGVQPQCGHPHLRIDRPVGRLAVLPAFLLADGSRLF